jgi:hypothetical protein
MLGRIQLLASTARQNYDGLQLKCRNNHNILVSLPLHFATISFVIERMSDQFNFRARIEFDQKKLRHPFSRPRTIAATCEFSYLHPHDVSIYQPPDGDIFH